ncbi:hypothetical protein KR032_007445 [Drosophila birchii]|nr:hypothetical protein KR032_007445 [Drosophila birchii]
MQSRHTQCGSQTMPGRKPPQQYETLINETSYMDLPNDLRSNIDKNRCRNTQTQGKSNSQRSRSLSPFNCSKYKSFGGNNTNMDMDDSDFYPEDTNCGQCSTVSRAMLQRSCLNETSLDKTNKCWAGRSTRTYTKTPEDYLAERTHTEFMEALVKDRGCPGFIQSTLNGNENFNEFAFDIAFPGPIPAKPFPVDPITLVEAIKLRIDYEREEIRRNYRPIATENIDTHFFDKNKTEVNEAVSAFLKAESQYKVNKEPVSGVHI